MELYIHIPFCVHKCLYCDFLSFDNCSETIPQYMTSLLKDISNEAERLYSFEKGQNTLEMSYIYEPKGQHGNEASDPRDSDNYCSCESNDNHIDSSDSIYNNCKYIHVSNGYHGNKSSEIESIYIGGGTPGILSSEQIQELMSHILSSFKVKKNAEITLETNPCTVTRDKAYAYKGCGINRISMGVQSFNDAELKLLGRAHNEKQVYTAFNILREAGFDNISIDLIQALPGQGENDFYDNLKKAISLGPEHISAYELIIEEGTPFHDMYGEESGYKFNEDIQADIYLKTVEILKANGYEQYEISNFARDGKISRHNYGYWIGKNYIGCGLGAVGYIGNRRRKKLTELDEYIKNPSGASELIIGEKEQRSEYIFLGMRTSRGIDIKEYENSFNEKFPEAFIKTLEQYIPKYVQKEESRYYFTPEGMLISNMILYRMC